MSNITGTKPLLDYKGAATYCGLSDKQGQTYFKNQVKQGHGPDYLKLSARVIRFTPAALDRWIESWQRVCRG